MSGPIWDPGVWHGLAQSSAIPGTTIDNIVIRIGRRLRRSVAEGTTLLVEVIDELVRAQDALEERTTLPWFLLHKEEEAALANIETISVVSDLVANFIRFIDDEPVVYIDPTGNAVEKVVLNSNSELLIMKQRFPGTGDIPKEYTLLGEEVIVRPIPTQAITYQFRFYRKDPTAPAAGVTTLWSTNFSDLLMNMAGKEIAWTLRDNDATARFEKDLIVAQSNFIKAIIAREQAGQVHVMGDP